MIANVRARYANGVLTPLEPLDLEDGKEVVVSIEDAAMPSATNGPSLEERGRAIYEQRIRGKVEGSEHGKVVVIDVESDYEIDPDDATATARLVARRPDALTYAVRVGHSAMYRMGARFSYRPQ